LRPGSVHHHALSQKTHVPCPAMTGPASHPEASAEPASIASDDCEPDEPTEPDELSEPEDAPELDAWRIVLDDVDAALVAFESDAPLLETAPEVLRDDDPLKC